MKSVGRDSVEPINASRPRQSTELSNRTRRAIVLLSGGLDSTTTLAIALAEGFEAYALSFDYGQRHKIEIVAARRIAQSLGAKEHLVVKIDNGAGGRRATWTGGP